MSKNYDRIATVTIDLQAPLIDNTSFDNLLLFGPPPKKAPKKAPPRVGTYSSMNEVLAAGWEATGEDPDPIGTAAMVAFGQSPTPVIFIATQQLSDRAIACGKAMKDVATAIETYFKNASIQNCTMTYDPDKRILVVTLTAEQTGLTGVQNSDLFKTCQAINTAGYKVKVGEHLITDYASFKKTDQYNKINSLARGGEAIHFSFHVIGDDDVDVPYGVIVQHPQDGVAKELEYTGEALGEPQKELEDAVKTLQRASGTPGWYVACPAGIDPKEYKDVADYIETQEKMFCYTELDFFKDPKAEEPKATLDPIYYRTAAIYGRENSDQPDEEVPDNNRFINVAFVAKWLGYASGSETTAFKALASVLPSTLTSTQMQQLEEGNVNYFITVGSRNVTMNGKVLGGEWADIIRFRDWLKNDMQVRVVNLFLSRPKVPYTDPGIALVQSQMIASLKAGQAAGGIAMDEYDEFNTLIPGFTTSVPLAASLTAAERASRILRNCKFKARLAGAIHFAELTGSLTYEL